MDECSHTNDLGYNPLLTAAEFKSRDALQILLEHLSQIAINEKRKRVRLNQIFHQSNQKSLLAIILQSDYFGEEIISKVVECEGHVHEWNSAKFYSCLYDNLKTSESTLKCINMFKEQNVQERGIVGKVKRAIIVCTIIALSSVMMSSVSFDVGSDVALLYQYSNNLLIETKFPTNCKCTESNSSKSLGKMNSTDNNIFLEDFKISSSNCFWYALIPIIIPCSLNLIEAISFVKMKESVFSFATKILIIVFSPLWLIIVFIYGCFEGLKKELRQKSEDDSEKLINDAKMIEVCTEASLQPILQLYLFFLSLLCSTDLYSTCINLWTIIQILSFLSSVLSVPRTFTQRYALNQNGMMLLESKAAYFLFSLSGVISRILSFQLLAFLSRQFWLIYAFVGAHVVLILIINLTFVKLGKSSTKQESKIKEDLHSQRWLHIIVSIKKHFLDAMANIYVPWTDGKNEKLDAKRHILVEVVLFVENLVISLWAVNSGFGHHALDKEKSKYLGVIWGCYSFYICLKLAFYVYLHPWSILIKNAISTKFALATKICQKNENPINEEEMKDIDGGEKIIIIHLSVLLNSFNSAESILEVTFWNITFTPYLGFIIQGMW